jgi:hypothetical protein
LQMALDLVAKRDDMMVLSVTVGSFTFFLHNYYHLLQFSCDLGITEGNVCYAYT